MYVFIIHFNNCLYINSRIVFAIILLCLINHHHHIYKHIYIYIYIYKHIYIYIYIFIYYIYLYRVHFTIVNILNYLFNIELYIIDNINL